MDGNDSSVQDNWSEIVKYLIVKYFTQNHKDLICKWRSYHLSSGTNYQGCHFPGMFIGTYPSLPHNIPNKSWQYYPQVEGSLKSVIESASGTPYELREVSGLNKIAFQHHCFGLTNLPVKWKWQSVMSDSLWPHGLCSPWNSLGQDTGVGSLSLLQGIFQTQGLNPGLPHCRWILYQLSHKGSPSTCLPSSKMEFERARK